MFLSKNNKFNFKITVVSLVLMSTVIFLLPQISSALIVVPQVEGLTTADLKTVVGSIIQVFLGLLGLIALVIVLYGGFVWMTSGGNEEKISNAKKILSAGVIGLVIILASYIITSFILESVQNALNNNQYNNGDGDGFGDGFGGGALGAGVIEYHYPQRDANNIPRNTLIMITFKVQVATSSVIATDGDGEIIEFDSGSEGANLCFNYTGGNNYNGNECGPLSDHINIIDDGSSISDNIVAVLQADGKNVLLKPIDILGDSEESTYTNVNLGSGMLSEEGDNLFGVNGYFWRFEVSTFSDETPPTVDFVWPEDNANNIFRNAIIQMTFSEPINILSVNQNNVTSTATIFGSLTGNLKISNQYRTVEFISNIPCDGSATNAVNSCGENVYCLPGNDDITTIINSGENTNPLSGISDAAGNMFDGNFNGIEDGDPADNYEWSFGTNNLLNITAPVITAVNPVNNLFNVQTNPSPRISATLDKIISPSSLNTDNFYIYDNTTCKDLMEETEDLTDDGYKDNVMDRNIPSQNDGCFPIYTTKVSDGSTKCNIELYFPYLKSETTNYRPRITSELRDSYGNCFNPSMGPGGRGQQGVINLEEQGCTDSGGTWNSTTDKCYCPEGYEWNEEAMRCEEGEDVG